MSIIQILLVHVPTWLLGFLIVGFYVASSVVGLIIIRKFYPHYKCKLHNDVAGFIFAALGVIYAVLLAFAVVVTWQDFDKASDVTSNEANCIASLYRDATPFPAGIRAQLKNELTNYVNAIVKDEWHKMARGERSSQVQKIQEKLWLLYGSFQPKNETQKIFLAASVKKLNEASQMRRQRIAYAGSGIHPLLYFIFIAGSFITIAFSLMFGTENLIPHIIMTSLLSAMIALILFTIIALDYPFTGNVSIKPDVFTSMLTSLMSS